MAGDELRVALEIEAGFALQHAQGRERDRHQRRLGVFGERQRLGRALEHDGGELGAERLVNFGKTCAATGKFAASALPMPTVWLPWPGNTKATAIIVKPLPLAVFRSMRVEIGPKDTALEVMSSWTRSGNQAKRLYRLGFH